MSKDVVLDTHVLADIIYQYYNFNILNGGDFREDGFVSKGVADKLNQIVKRYLYEEDFKFGIVVTSIFSFVEIVRQFRKISDNKFSLNQFKAFVTQPPIWLTIIPLSMDLYPFFYHVPKNVLIGNELKAIEWPDAVHCATYLSRENAFIATADTRILAIPDFTSL